MATLSSLTLPAKLSTPPHTSRLWLWRPSPSSLRLQPSHPSPSPFVCLAKRSPRPDPSPPSSSELPGTLLDDPPLPPDEDFVRPSLPGDEPDFWEGPQWNLLGFIVEYLWAIGIVVALVGCLIAVRTYNSGASDFKDTAVFKEAMKSQGMFEDSTAFEESPKDAPSVQENPS